MIILRMTPSSTHIERHAVHDVVMISGRVGDELRGLALADLVGCARHHGLLALGGRREGEGERPEREAPEILAERGSRPGLAAVSGDLDGLDAIAAVPGDARD